MSSARQLFRRVNEKVKLRGDELEHEQTDAWSNRDLIPLPPRRRTWGVMEYFGFWTISSFSIITWQIPGAFLATGLSAGQTMAVIVVSRFIIMMWSFTIAWAGLTFHIGYTVQNRYSWGMRGAYLPLLQRVLLNFIWCAIGCWNGGRLAAVCITAIWPSFNTLPNRLPAGMRTTTSEFVGFTVFWVLTLPLLWIPPEKFRRPFQFVSVYTGIALFSVLVWSLAKAKGVGPVFYAGQNTTKSPWSISWLIVAGINSSIGSQAAGMTNGSDFSRYAKNKSGYIIGTFSCLFLTGTLVSLIGLATTAACQRIFGTVFWNPPDLFMAIMDGGKGSSGSRVAVFFLSLGFGLSSMFENVVGNGVAGGIDLAGIFPLYINIRRGAIITVVFAWVCQPWQLVNRASTFLSVISSFSVFLAPIMGVMVADFHFVRKMRVKLSELYKSHGDFWYFGGFNWRAFPAWAVGWAPTVGGLALTSNPKLSGPRVLYELYFVAFFYGFFSSLLVFYLTNLAFPIPRVGDMDGVDVYGTFTREEAKRLCVVPASGGDGVSEKTHSRQDGLPYVPE